MCIEILILQALFEKQFANDPKVLEVLLQFYLKSGNCMILDHIEMSVSCSSAVQPITSGIHVFLHQNQET